MRSLWRGGFRKRTFGSTSLVAGLAFVLWTRASAADDETPFDVQVVYDAPPECPPRERFVEEIRRRIDPSWHAGLDKRQFAAHVERTSDGAYRGTLAVRGGDSHVETREVRGTTCADVSKALVVFVAIALDPSMAPEPTPTPAPEPTPPVPEPPPPSSPRPSTPRRPTRSSPPARWRFTSGIDVAFLHPGHDAWGARVNAELARAREAQRVWPAIRLSWGFADFESAVPGGGDADFRLRTGRASACAHVALKRVPVELVPCLGFDFGTLAATSSNLPREGRGSTAWYAGVGTVRVAWPILRWLSIEGELGLEVPFTRTTFGVDEPVRIVYRPPGAFFTSGAGLAIGGAFP